MKLAIVRLLKHAYEKDFALFQLLNPCFRDLLYIANNFMKTVLLECIVLLEHIDRFVTIFHKCMNIVLHVAIHFLLGHSKWLSRSVLVLLTFK